MPDPIVSAILRGAQRRGLDAQAVLAVARVEGLGGGVGDQGTSFGPFQLHIGGAMPRGIRNPQQWARSQQGIDYALNQIARVAQGKRGRAAVEAIVRGFERPADPTGEIARALGHYGRVGGGGGALSPPAGAAIGSRQPAAPDLTGLFNLTRSIVGLPEITSSAYAPVRAPALQRRPYTRAGAQPALGVPKRGKTINYLIHFAAPYGLQVTSTTTGGHVKGSYHYKGRAVDFGGDPSRMAALANAALQHPQDFVEMFYTGPGHPGYFIKNGRAYPLSQLNRTDYDNHTNHVHIAR